MTNNGPTEEKGAPQSKAENEDEQLVSSETGFELDPDSPTPQEPMPSSVEPALTDEGLLFSPEEDVEAGDGEESISDDLFEEALQEDVDQSSQSLMGEESSSEEGTLSFVEELTLEGQIEAVLFASPKALKSNEIFELLSDDDLELSKSEVEDQLMRLKKLYEERAGGFRLYFEPGEGYQFRTVPAASHLMEQMFSSRPRPLSRAALETLSIIAYRQPTTRAEIEYVRGVDAGSIIKNLLDRDLIACVGRKEDAGRPMIFGTTKEFLKVFRIKALSDLPSLSAFQVPSETKQQAEADLENIEGVDVELFVGDETEEPIAFSDGLVEDDLVLPPENLEEKPGATREASTNEETIERKDENTEMDVPAGGSVSKAGGDLDI
ncbi:MAG: SMC-Scp complex subunit ScpB [Pseudobacteriovorax sp.]|nr:SMC-Scp complex subunit ScpB [Pseudobacteriovorax sp.]